MSEKEIQSHDEGIKLYELGFNLVSSLPEEALDKEFNNLKEIINKKAKEMVKEGKPALINLAYTISKVVDSKKQKYDTAYFGWIKFKTEPEKLTELKSELDFLPSLLRYVLIKATKEGEIPADEIARAISGEAEIKEDDLKDEEVVSEVEILDEVEKEKEVLDPEPKPELKKEVKEKAKSDKKKIDEDKVDEAIEKLIN